MQPTLVLDQAECTSAAKWRIRAFFAAQQIDKLTRYISRQKVSVIFGAMMVQALTIREEEVAREAQLQAGF